MCVRWCVSTSASSSSRTVAASAADKAAAGVPTTAISSKRIVPWAMLAAPLRQALVNLEAVPAPAGTLAVVLGPGLVRRAAARGRRPRPGGDFNRKGSSAYSGRIGERVASSLCTIVDDGTLAGRRGSLSVDDEGTPTSAPP